ncbi:acyl-CoA/acyl-ACP dehydrogenase [Myxococcota bacterium]|nr:acyl-CoA/acyl-ACP dehydrogenase [Myxococcota bacterium]
MNFGFTEEQQFLRDSVRKFLDERASIPHVRNWIESDPGMSLEFWRELAELGWLGLTIPETHGGAGLGWVELTVLFEETGRSLLPSPLLSTTLASTAILDHGTPDQRSRWLPSLADGSRVGSIAILEPSDHLVPSALQARGEADGSHWRIHGEKSFICDIDRADFFVTAFRTGENDEEISLAIVDRGAPGVHTEKVPCLDSTKSMGRLKLDGVQIAPEAMLGAPHQAWPAVERLMDQGAVAATAEAVGSAEAVLAITVQYAKDRVQFGQPIGHFQGVKHPLAEMHVDIESIKSLLYYAAWSLEGSPAETPRYSSLAKLYASDAFTRIGVDCVQLHGAVGYTMEYDAQLYLKRSKWFRPMFGDADHHADRLAALRGLR